MRIKSFILAAAALLTLALSCEPKKPALGVTVDPKALVFTADGGTQTVQATANTWTVTVPESAKEWLHVSPLSGSGTSTVQFTASANPGKPRSVSVSFTSGIITESVAITQEGLQKVGDGKTYETAFSASEARAWVMANLSDGQVSSENFFIKGIIHKMAKSGETEQYFASNSFGNASFFISDDGESSADDFECFQVNYLGNRAWQKGDTDVKIGDHVVIYGPVTLYKTTPETSGKGAAYLVALNDQVDIPKEPELATGTITETIKTEDGNKVEVGEAIVAALSGQGFIATDGTSNVYVYLKANPTVSIGDKVSIKANKTTYYGLPEFTDPEVTVKSSGNDVPRTALKDISDNIDKYDASVAEYITVKGKLVKDGDYFNVEVSGAARKATPSALHSSFKLDGMVGKMVEMTGYFNTIHSSKNLVQIVVTEVKEGNQDAAFLSVSNKDITVKAEATSASFTIEANKAWTIVSDNGTFVPSPSSGEGDATVTVSFPANTEDAEKVAHLTITCGDKSVVVTITQRSVNAEPTDTVTAVVSAEDDTDVEINEAIVAALSTRGCIVTDGKTNVYVYANAVPSAKIGDMVSVKGKKTTYYGLPEITGPTITVVSSGNEVPRTAVVELGPSNIDSYDSSAADYLCVVGTLKKDGNYWKVFPDGAARYASPDYMISDINPSALENQQVKLYGYFNTIHSANNYVKVIATEIVPADDNVKYLTVSPESLKTGAEGGDLSVTVSSNQAWTASAQAAFLSVSPASGQGNGTVKVTVAANPDEADRTGTIVVKGADGTSVEITVSQGAKPAEGTGSVSWDKGKLASASDKGATVQMDGVISFTNDSSYSGSVTELRVYKGKNLVVTAAAGYKITSIEMTCTASGTSNYGPGKWGDGAPSGYSYDGKVGTWTGAQQSVSFNATDGQVRIEELTVNYKAD